MVSQSALCNGALQSILHATWITWPMVKNAGGMLIIGRLKNGMEPENNGGDSGGEKSDIFWGYILAQGILPSETSRCRYDCNVYPLVMTNSLL